MKVRTIEIAGMASVLQALRLPFGKECRSVCDMNFGWNDRCIEYHNECRIDENDMTLLSTLVKRGAEHAKAIRGLVVYAEIEAPIYFLREMETYRFGRERLGSNSTMHQLCRGLRGEELVQAKAEMPMGTVQKTIDMFSYQCLRNIVKQRHNHRLPEWAVFIEWVKGLPYSQELIFANLDLD